MARLSVLQLYKKCQELTDAATSMGFSVIQKADYYVWKSNTLGNLIVVPFIDNSVNKRTIEKIHKAEDSNVVIVSLSDVTISSDLCDWEWLTPTTLDELKHFSEVYHETPDKFSFAWNLYFNSVNNEGPVVNENAQDNSVKVKTGHFYSWEIVDTVTAYKTCDSSFFKYRGSGVPHEISWFFDADSFGSGDSRDVSFEFEGTTYQGRVVNSSTNGRCIQVYWKSVLGKLFDAYSLINGIRVKFTKTEDASYSIVFVDKNNIEVHDPLPLSENALEKNVPVRTKLSPKNAKKITKSSVIPENISRLLNQKLQCSLVNEGKQSLLCTDCDRLVLYFYSKEYEKANNVKEYWYSIRANQNKLLSAYNDSYCAFDMPDIESIALIPYGTIKKILPQLPTSPHGGDPYWHIKIRYNGERFWLLTSGKERYAPNEKLYLDSPELEICVLGTGTHEKDHSDVLTCGSKKIKISSTSMKEIKIKGGK